MCSSPYSPRARARTLSTDSSARFNSSRTSSRKSFPSAVSVTPRGLRRKRSTPISSSRSCTCRLNAGCATRRCAAALVKFNASPTAKKYRRCRSSTAHFHHAEKAWLRNKHGIGQIQNAPVSAQYEKHIVGFESVQKVHILGAIKVVHGDVADQPHGNARYQRSLLPI